MGNTRDLPAKVKTKEKLSTLFQIFQLSLFKCAVELLATTKKQTLKKSFFKL